MDLPIACDLGELKYTERLGQLYLVNKTVYLPVFGLAYCFLGRPFDNAPFVVSLSFGSSSTNRRMTFSGHKGVSARRWDCVEVPGVGEWGDGSRD